MRFRVSPSLSSNSGILNFRAFNLPSCLAGTPRPPRFTCDEIAYGGHAYNITWTTDTFEPVTEYKLLYRRSNVSPRY